MRVVSFKADETILALLESYSRERKITKSELIRRAIREYFEQQQRPKIYVTKRLRVY